VVIQISTNFLSDEYAGGSITNIIESHVIMSLSSEMPTKSKKCKSDLEASQFSRLGQQPAGQPLRKEVIQLSVPGRMLSSFTSPELKLTRHLTHQFTFITVISTSA
jgi:hypothetical protein